jgi:uncharacterized membrane protein
LRISTITAESLWWDEVITLQQSRGSIADLIRMVAADNYPPLHNILVQLSIRVLGESEFALRLPSAILGALTVLLVYWVGVLLNSRWGGVIAASLLAVAGFHIWYSQEARAYALMAFAATAYAGCILWVAQKPGWPRMMANVLAGTALLYSHPYGMFLFASLAGAMVLLLMRRGDWAIGPVRFALLQAIAALAFVPWAFVLLARTGAIDATVGWIPEVTALRVLYYLMQVTTGPAMLLAVFVCALVLLVIRPRSTTQIVLLGAWALGPLAIGVVLSLATQPLLVQRYLIGSLPALLLIVGIAAMKLEGVVRTAMIAVVALAGITSYVAFWPPARTDFRGIAHQLQARMTPDDCLVIWSWAWIGLDYYYDAPPCLLVRQGPEPSDALYADLDFAGHTPGSIFVVLTNDENTDNPHLSALGERIGLTEFGDSRLMEIKPN